LGRSANLGGYAPLGLVGVNRGRFYQWSFTDCPRGCRNCWLGREGMPVTSAPHHPDQERSPDTEGGKNDGNHTQDESDANGNDRTLAGQATS
jgi:hypothetical protein